MRREFITHKQWTTNWQPFTWVIVTPRCSTPAD